MPNIDPKIALGNLQIALSGLGFDVGPIDGVRGARTEAALRSLVYQWGLVGATEVQKLTPYAVAIGLLSENLREDPSQTRSNPKIKKIFETVSPYFGKFDDSKLPWCGIVMAYLFLKAGYARSVLPQYVESARAWLDFGAPTTAPERGDVVVISRGADTSSGHVFLFERIVGDAVEGIGGNQSDSFTRARFLRSRVLGYRTYNK